MTDNEIIKALECCCIALNCEECPCRGNNGTCTGVADFEVLDLINRQKAEIENLRHNLKLLVNDNLHRMNENLQILEIIKMLTGGVSKELVNKINKQIEDRECSILKEMMGDSE